jgi:hypothetical protein
MQENMSHLYAYTPVAIGTLPKVCTQRPSCALSHPPVRSHGTAEKRRGLAVIRQDLH